MSITRRTFLASSTAVAGLALPATAADPKPAPKRNRIGVSTYSFWQFRQKDLRDVETCIDLAGEIVEGAAEILGDQLAGLNPLDEHVEIVELALQRVAELHVLLEPAAALEHFLRVGLILPEIRSGDAFF